MFNPYKGGRTINNPFVLSGLLSSEPDPLFNKNVRSCSSAGQYALKPQKKQVNFLISQKPRVFCIKKYLKHFYFLIKMLCIGLLNSGERI